LEVALVSEKSGRWIVAAERLTENPKDRVPCPVCKTGFLETTAADFPDGSHTDVYMKCPVCGSANVLTYMKEER
jgi:hypothetical protein